MKQENKIESTVNDLDSLHLKAKTHEVSSKIQKMWKLYAMSLVMQTCQNNLGLNLCVVPPTSHVIIISENGLEKSYKKRNKVYHH